MQIHKLSPVGIAIWKLHIFSSINDIPIAQIMEKFSNSEDIVDIMYYAYYGYMCVIVWFVNSYLHI